MIKIKRFYFNEFRECCIVAGDETGECVIVDPGCGTAEEKAELYGYIEKEGLKPEEVREAFMRSLDRVFGKEKRVLIFQGYSWCFQKVTP